MLSISQLTIMLFMSQFYSLHYNAVLLILSIMLPFQFQFQYMAYIRSSNLFSQRTDISLSHFSIVSGLVVIQLILFICSKCSTICRNFKFSSSREAILSQYSLSYPLNLSLISLMIIKYCLFNSPQSFSCSILSASNSFLHSISSYSNRLIFNSYFIIYCLVPVSGVLLVYFLQPFPSTHHIFNAYR